MYVIIIEKYGAKHMDYLRNVQTIVAIVSGLLSIIMFFLARNEKKKCVEIRNNIEQNIQVFNKESSIKSKDNFNIEQVKTFDNRKSIN
jgi:predicted amino acid-binding ACT domain protein